MRIFAFHLLNDYSGSPKVLMQLAKKWVHFGIETHIVTCRGREGFLSNIPGVSYHYYWYQWAANPLKRLFHLTISQLLLVYHLVFIVKKEDIIYINTVLPFGAAVLGKIKGCRIVYHIHETTMKPAVLKRFLFGMARWVAHDIVYVSQYLAKQEPFSRQKTHILPNAIEDAFLEKAKQNRKPVANPRNVLMVCSLKSYKGVFEFIALAQENPHFEFRMVMNAARQEIDSFFHSTTLPTNLSLFDTQTNLHPFYQWADVILNLSQPDGWVETFGLTIIEGMAYGLPAIVPPVGGICELVEEGINGFRVDCRNTQQLNEKLNHLLKNIGLYTVLRENALEKIESFSEKHFGMQSLYFLNPILQRTTLV